MQTNELILAEEFCTHNDIGISFITSLHEYGLIEIKSVENSAYIQESELQKLEQFVRWHYDLNINFEGIDVICNLLERVQNLQSELNGVKNRLRLYEQDDL